MRFAEDPFVGLIGIFREICDAVLDALLCLFKAGSQKVKYEAHPEVGAVFYLKNPLF